MKLLIKIVPVIILILLTGCKKENENPQIESSEVISVDTKDTAASVVEEKSDDNKIIPKVTFIELGSVNCVPCKMMQPVMKQVEDAYKDQVKVVFYDVWTDADAQMGEKYRIRVIPTQVFLDDNGNEYYRHEGFFPYEELVKILGMKGVK